MKITEMIKALMLVASLAATEYREPVPEHSLIAFHATRAGLEYQVNPSYLVAIAWRESRFRFNAIGDNGRSCGPFQVRHDIRNRPTCEALMNPATSAKWAANYLVHMRNVCSDVDKFAAYNAGCSGARQGRGVGYSNRVRLTASRI